MVFITFTTNSTWPDIIRELLLSKDANDYSDLVGYVLKLKSHDIEQLLYNSLFSKFTGIIWTIEY